MLITNSIIEPGVDPGASAVVCDSVTSESDGQCGTTNGPQVHMKLYNIYLPRLALKIIFAICFLVHHSILV